MRALVVDDTLWVVALCVGVASPAVGAEASCAVVPGLASCRDATLGEAAGIHTSSVYALVRQGALQVAVATS